MNHHLLLLIYRLLLPLLFLIAFPGWLLKMIKRGGLKTPLLERIGLYKSDNSSPSKGKIHIHASSVGETAIALKLITAWQQEAPQQHFVLATTTSTGYDLATAATLPQVSITYIPLDFTCVVKSYLNHFSPRSVILIESEIWPNFLIETEKRSIPVHLANARTSPRSQARLLKFATALSPFYRRLHTVCIQEKSHLKLWTSLGIPPSRIHHTGSIKFDPESIKPPEPRPEFATILKQFGNRKPYILAASTFPGEEAAITAAIFTAFPNALPIIVPRHAERRKEVCSALEIAGFTPILRTNLTLPPEKNKTVLVIDTTGELPTWTTHADLVIIGKSFLSTGGQNPAEAILARKPLIFGPHMENFQPLAHNLLKENGSILAETIEELPKAIREALEPNFSLNLDKFCPESP